MPLPRLADFGFSAGELIDGKYRLERLLGSGGAGVVVAAHHLKLDEPRALKLLRPEVLGDSHIVARFEREARAVVKIKGEHVCAVHDVGSCPRFGPYIVMELLEGEDLRMLVERRGALPIADATGYMLQALEALAQAHALGIVHRDLKPGNLFLARLGQAPVLKVVDFGISKLVGDAVRPGEPALTKPTMIMGSLPYVSPEQAKDPTAVDARADIWGVGVVLYELLTATRAFAGSTPSAVLLQVMTVEPPSARAVRPEVPANLEAVIARCLAKERDDRFQTVGDLALALGGFVPGSSALVGQITRLSPPTAAPIVAPVAHALAHEAGAPPSGTLLIEESAATQEYQVPRSVGSAPTLFQPPTPSRPGPAGAPSSRAVETTEPARGSPAGPSAPGEAAGYGGRAAVGMSPVSAGVHAPSPPSRARRSPGLGVAVGVLFGVALLVALAWGAFRVMRGGAESESDAMSVGAPASGRTAAPEGTLEAVARAESNTAPSAAAPAEQDAGTPLAGGSSSAPDTMAAVAGSATGAPPRGPSAPSPAAGGKPKNPLTDW